MIQAMHIAAAGLQASGQKFMVAANDVVKAGVPENQSVPTPESSSKVQVDLPRAFVDMKLAEQSYKASLVVLLTAQEMSTALLDSED